MLDFNMPHLTDTGAIALGEALGKGAEALGARATENLAKAILPIVLLGFGWLAFAFYKESRSSSDVQHTVEHKPRPAP